nr:VOC family protein [uncultured Akkermansia sp.]
MKKNMNRVTVICLGVIDMKKSLQFYRDKLGFKTDETGDNPDVVFFSTPGTKLELYPLDLLAKDIDPEQHHDFRRPRDGHPVWFVNPGVTSGEMMLTRQALLDFHNFLFRDGIVGQCYPSEAGTEGRRIVR